MVLFNSLTEEQKEKLIMDIVDGIDPEDMIELIYDQIYEDYETNNHDVSELIDDGEIVN